MSRESHSDDGSNVRFSRRRVLQTAAATGAVTAGMSASASADTDPQFENGRAQPVYEDDEVIRESYWVETPTDTDGSGEPDRVHVEIARPESTLDDDVQLPVVIQPSPYYGGPEFGLGFPTEVELYEPDKPGRDLEDAAQDRSRKVYDDYSHLAEFTGSSGPNIGPGAFEQELLKYGYVWAYVSSIGTEQSTGCPTVGGPEEIAGVKSVVDWLNGRADGYVSPVSDETAEAHWTTGKTGMIGISYNGTLPNGVATTGVEGLETIVPIVAISNWYDYYRANGHVASGLDMAGLGDYVLTREDAEVCDPVIEEIIEKQDRVTGDYNDWWYDRNYLPDVENQEASVLICHGLADFNVDTGHAAKLADELDTHDVPYKVWLHQSGHGDFLSFGRHEDEWIDMLNRWFTRWLFGVENGVMDEPTATIEREDGDLTDYADWPDPDAEHVGVHFREGGETAGGLALDRMRGRPVEESFVDAPNTTIDEHVAAGESDHRLVYRSGELQEDVRISGTPFPDLRLSFDEPAANLTVAVVEYGPDGDVEVVNRGWANPQNRKSVSETFALHPPDRPYRIEFDVHAIDRVFEAGSEIGVAVMATDPSNGMYRPPETRVEVSVDLKGSEIRLPVVGGEDALDAALPN